MAEAKSTFDNPLAEPESAPQIAAEPQPAVAEVEAPSSVAEAPSSVGSEPLPEPAPVAEPSPVAAEEKPAKAAAAG
jgi:sec-independent protein translocase protein TatB